MGKDNYGELTIYFGKKTKEFRKMKKNMTQEALAERVGITANQVSRIERGIHFPTSRILLKLIYELDIPEEDYLHTAIKIMKENDEYT
jgi:transcriptional regulator with XRE-family HTH domain